ncbi:MAG: hypothetical protein L3J96_00705, partial [Thermoplasmata archaeon]|nr:hypothetical protein [Thermoplasmata archaeon]
MVEYNKRSPYYGLNDEETSRKKAEEARSLRLRQDALNNRRVNVANAGAEADAFRRAQAAENETRDANGPAIDKKPLFQPPQVGSHGWTQQGQAVLAGASPSAVTQQWTSAYQADLRVGARAKVAAD